MAKKAVKLTAAEKKALRLIVRGADITGYDLAKTLRGIEAKAPHLIDIGPEMGQYDVRDKLPYFGAIATAAGRLALKVETEQRQPERRRA